MTAPTFLLTLWLLPSLLAGDTPTLSPAQQLTLLEQANNAFQQALDSAEPPQAQGYYQQAITAYEQLIAAEVHNARLYYNLGNAYFRRKDLGRAILNYRRGLRLEPGNQRLLANLRYARSRRIDAIDATTPRPLLPQLLFWHDDLGLRAQWTLAVATFLLAWGCAFAYLFWRRPSLRWLRTVCALVCVLFAASALTVHAQNTSALHGVIVAEEAAVRKGNGESYTLQLPQPLHAGTEFTVLEERGAWLHLQLDNGTQGWIRREWAGLW